MTKWVLRLVPMTALLATTAIAQPVVWVRTSDQTEVRGGRITEVDASGRQIVIEDQARLTIPPSAQVALAEVRPGETVDVRFTEIGPERTVLSLHSVVDELQAP